MGSGIKRTITCERGNSTQGPIKVAWSVFPSTTPPADGQPSSPTSPLGSHRNPGGRWGKTVIYNLSNLPINTETVRWSYGGWYTGDNDRGGSRIRAKRLTPAQVNSFRLAYGENRPYDSVNGTYDQLVFPSRYNIAREIAHFAWFASEDHPSDIAQVKEYYDFETPAPFANSYLLDEILDSLGTDRGLAVRTIDSAATINPEYNYYLQEYERAITPDRVPEAVLPNLYIYSFMSDNNNILDRPEWQDGEQEAELTSQNYDRLITLGEFSGHTLPRLTSEDNGFQNDYLQSYATAVQNVVIDMTSSLSQNYKTSISPASEMNFYNAMNGRKHQFPMYIELSIPTLPVLANSVTHMMGTTKTSTGMLNSLITSTPEAHTFKCRTQFFFEPNSNRDNNRSVWQAYRSPAYDARRNRRNQHLGTRITNILGQVYNFDTWMNGVLDDIEAMVVTGEGRERVEGQCARFQDRIMVEAMRNNIRNLAQSSAVKYSDMLQGKKCENETIAYKLIKKNNRDEIIQTFYLPNTSDADVIKFVDTQVKYNKFYKYELMGYAVVYGSKYRFTTRARSVGSTLDNNDPLHPDNMQRDAGSPVTFVFDVETIPNPKVVEYSIFSEDYKIPTDRFLSSGVSFPPVKVLDRPPMPPEMQLHPYRNNYQQILINIQPGTGASVGQEAINFIPLSGEDITGSQGQYAIAINQKQFENYDLVWPKLEFKSEGSSEVKRIEIYRTNTINQNVESYDDAYKSFGSVPYKVLDISNDEDLEEAEIAKAFDFVDTLTPNLVYYYTCRSIDAHGKKSNPAAIYEVKLNYDKGLYYPTIDLLKLRPVPIKRPTKQLAQFIEIKACDLQTYVNNNLQPNEAGEEVLVSERGFISEAQHDVATNHFLVRVSSKDTGRKIDFKLVFSKPPSGA